MVLGAKLYGILVPWWDQKFRLGPSFHGILVPRTNFFGDKFSRDNCYYNGQTKLLKLIQITFECHKFDFICDNFSFNILFGNNLYNYPKILGKVDDTHRLTNALLSIKLVNLFEKDRNLRIEILGKKTITISSSIPLQNMIADLASIVKKGSRSLIVRS